MSDIAQRIVSLARRRNTLRSRCYSWLNESPLHRSLMDCPDWYDYARVQAELDSALEEAGRDADEVSHVDVGRSRGGAG